MNDAVGLPTPVRWVDRQAADRPDPAPGSCALEADWRVKSLVGLGALSALVGVLYTLVLVDATLNREAPYSWGEGWEDGWWLATLGLGFFLFFQWVRVLRGKPLLIPTPRLWRVSTFYVLYLVALGIFLCSAQLGMCGSWAELQDTLLYLAGLLMFPLAGLPLTSSLWLRASRP